MVPPVSVTVEVFINAQLSYLPPKQRAQWVMCGSPGFSIELGTGTEDRTGFFPVILDRTGFLYRCTVLYLTVRHAESC